MKTRSNSVSRRFLLAGLPAGILVAACSGGRKGVSAEPVKASASDNKWLQLTEDDWRARLTPMQFKVLRQEATERAFTSPLNDEHREGVFHCAGCDLPLFSSKTKYKSGTGWPSFWKSLDGAMETKPDHSLFVTRTEYHCSRCKGHQGHVFDDGPRPTGQRWCNNGVALTFRPDAA